MTVFTAKDLKNSFFNFFIKEGHLEIPSASLLPENDPSALFISAGMHPLTPYLLGQAHPLGKRLVNVQKCLRTGDIAEVGDAFHHTFFEMLGNWSLGDYDYRQMIPWNFEFLTKNLKIDTKNLHVTCFAGDISAPKDSPVASLWQSLGVNPDNIHFLPAKDNWWGPVGSTGPCGPDSEMFVDTRPTESVVEFLKGCRSGRFVEIWNSVFMSYLKQADGSFLKADSINIDTGMGVERTVAVLNGLDDNYLSPIFLPLIKKIEEISGHSYQQAENQTAIRIVADHLRSAVFVIADGVEPGNKEAGYVLRRLIRRAIVQARDLGIDSNFVGEFASAVIDNQENYADDYPELSQNRQQIIEVLVKEEDAFRHTLDRGLRQIDKLIKGKELSGLNAFTLYQSYGFPIELIKEEIKKRNYILEPNFDVNFKNAKEGHTKLSRTLSSGKFKSGLADNSEIITKYHTSTHLLHSALRQVLGDHVSQVGSNITADRLRFDFTHPDKLTDAQIKKVEDLVNCQISAGLSITCQNLALEEAKKQGALAFFSAKYPDKVSVYTVGQDDKIFSSEICTGPHVSNTADLLPLKITKQESSGSGKRRLYAVFG